jgi:hypothetical protein
MLLSDTKTFNTVVLRGRHTIIEKGPFEIPIVKCPCLMILSRDWPQSTRSCLSVALLVMSVPLLLRLLLMR